MSSRFTAFPLQREGKIVLHHLRQTPPQAQRPRSPAAVPGAWRMPAFQFFCSFHIPSVTSRRAEGEYTPYLLVQCNVVERHEVVPGNALRDIQLFRLGDSRRSHIGYRCSTRDKHIHRTTDDQDWLAVACGRGPCYILSTHRRDPSLRNSDTPCSDARLR